MKYSSTWPSTRPPRGITVVERRERTSRTFSADVGSGLRIVFLHESHALTVLALTGEEARA